VLVLGPEIQVSLSHIKAENKGLTQAEKQLGEKIQHNNSRKVFPAQNRDESCTEYDKKCSQDQKAIHLEVMPIPCQPNEHCSSNYRAD
jgi:hypothetical protein